MIMCVLLQMCVFPQNTEGKAHTTWCYEALLKVGNSRLHTMGCLTLLSFTCLLQNIYPLLYSSKLVFLPKAYEIWINYELFQGKKFLQNKLNLNFVLKKKPDIDLGLIRQIDVNMLKKVSSPISLMLPLYLPWLYNINLLLEYNKLPCFPSFFLLS